MESILKWIQLESTWLSRPDAFKSIQIDNSDTELNYSRQFAFV